MKKRELYVLLVPSRDINTVELQKSMASGRHANLFCCEVVADEDLLRRVTDIVKEGNTVVGVITQVLPSWKEISIPVIRYPGDTGDVSCWHTQLNEVVMHWGSKFLEMLK